MIKGNTPHLAVPNVRIEPRNPPEYPPEPGYPPALGRGEARVGWHRAEEILLDLATRHQVVVGGGADDLMYNIINGWLHLQSAGLRRNAK